MLRFNLVVLGVYRVQGTTKEECVPNVVHVEMKCHHLYIVHDAIKATNVAVVYRTKHDIVDNDMVYGFHFI